MAKFFGRSSEVNLNPADTIPEPPLSTEDAHRRVSELYAHAKERTGVVIPQPESYLGGDAGSASETPPILQIPDSPFGLENYLVIGPPRPSSEA